MPFLHFWQTLGLPIYNSIRQYSQRVSALFDTGTRRGPLPEKAASMPLSLAGLMTSTVKPPHQGSRLKAVVKAAAAATSFANAAKSGAQAVVHDSVGSMRSIMDTLPPQTPQVLDEFAAGVRAVHSPPSLPNYQSG